MLTIRNLTEQLIITDPKPTRFRERILACKNKKAMQEVLDQQCENKQQTNCYLCDDEGNCSVLRGIAYLHISNIKKALDEIEDANVHFRGENNEWNNTICLTLLGIAHEKDNKRHQALLDYQQALHILDNYLYIHENNYDHIYKASSLIEDLRDRLDHRYYGPAKETPRPVKNKTRIVLPWMPAYTGLQAGTNGPVWAGPLPKDKGPFVDEILLDDKSHEIYSIKQGDNLVTLTRDKKYGWAKVSGNSMNASKPVFIFENDFVLFYESADADNNSIVIASFSDGSGAGYRYMVKRFSKDDQSLISETEPPNLYAPMSITADVKIIGVVIAVAKAHDSAGGHKNQQETDAPKNNESFYKELLQLVQGNYSTAERLIDQERDLSPQSSRDICIDRAIARLLKDRRA